MLGAVLTRRLLVTPRAATFGRSTILPFRRGYLISSVLNAQAADAPAKPAAAKKAATATVTAGVKKPAVKKKTITNETTLIGKPPSKLSKPKKLRAEPKPKPKPTDIAKALLKEPKNIKPKRPYSPFLRYIVEYSKQHPVGPATGIAKAAGVEWRAMTVDDKQKYATPVEDWVSYKTELINWSASHTGDEIRAINRARHVLGKHKLVQVPKDKRRIESSFFRFGSDMREKMGAELMEGFVHGSMAPVAYQALQIAQLWKALPQAEKDAYTKDYQERKAKLTEEQKSQA